ncbi:MAG: outer membrane protein assembly factor BamB [Verrucomicrobiales bacterium]
MKLESEIEKICSICHNTRNMKALIGLILSILANPCSSFAEPQWWNQFRGPNGSGVMIDCHPPVDLEKNLAWKVPVGAGLSSPALSDGRVFLTITENRRLFTVAFEKSTGKLVWRRGAPDVPLEKVHATSSPATPTPLVEGDRVYVYFGSFGLLCYDTEGTELWKKSIPTPKSLYGMATSPIMYGDHLILVLDTDTNLPDSKLSQSKIIAVDKTNGKTAWEIARPFNRSSWSVPMIWKHDDRSELVVLGSGRVSGYDLERREEEWFATGFSRETIAIPIAGDGKIFIAAAMLGGSGDEQPDPLPFWNAIKPFDKNNDDKIERAEMTAGFTFPFRPELPIGHPGFGLPLPKEGKEREKRLDGVLRWVDKDNNGVWEREEFLKNMSGGRGKPILMAIKPGGKGNINDTHVEWQLHRGIPEIPSPIHLDKRVYLVRKGGLVNAVDAVSGDVIYRERIDGAAGQYSASPVIANDKLYAISAQGVMSILATGDDFEMLHQHDLGEAAHVTPALDQNTIYIRGENHLFAFRRPKPSS